MATSQMKASNDLTTSESSSRKVSTQNIISRVLLLFAAATPIHDLLGLEYFQFLIHIEMIWAIKLSRDHLREPLELEHWILLKIMLNILASWVPLSYQVSAQLMEDSCSLNVPACFEAIILSIKNAISKFEDFFYRPEFDQRKLRYLQYFATIKEHIDRIKNIFTSRFTLYPAFSGNPNSDFHCITLNFVSGKSYRHDSNLKFLHNFVKYGMPSSLMCVAVNSPVVEKIRRLTYPDLMRSSTDPICQICREDLGMGQDLGCFPMCNHICCSRCIQTWFQMKLDKRDVW